MLKETENNIRKMDKTKDEIIKFLAYDGKIQFVVQQQIQLKKQEGYMI